MIRSSLNTEIADSYPRQNHILIAASIVEIYLVLKLDDILFINAYGINKENDVNMHGNMPFSRP